MLLDSIGSPADLRKLDASQLPAFLLRPIKLPPKLPPKRLAVAETES